MAKKKTTVVFVSDALPVAAVLTFIMLDKAGRMRVEYSIRSASPLPVEVMYQVHAVWEGWVQSCVDGKSPGLPEGWRVSGEGREAPTSRPPNHLH